MKDLNVENVKKSIFGLRNTTLKKLFKYVANFKSKNEQFINLLTDLIVYRVGYPTDLDITKLFFVLTFQQKSFDFLKLSNIFREHKQLFPIKNIALIPTFKYNRTLGSILFNYRFVSQNIEEFLNLS